MAELTKDADCNVQEARDSIQNLKSLILADLEHRAKRDGKREPDPAGQPHARHYGDRVHRGRAAELGGF